MHIGVSYVVLLRSNESHATGLYHGEQILQRFTVSEINSQSKGATGSNPCWQQKIILINDLIVETGCSRRQ
jgi:hypothetical protein